MPEVELRIRHNASTACCAGHIGTVQAPGAVTFVSLGEMATLYDLPRLEIPKLTTAASAMSSSVGALSPAVPSASVTLPRVPSQNDESQRLTEENLLSVAPHINPPFLSATVSPTYVDFRIPPTIRTHLASSPFHSRSTSTSSPELLVPGRVRTPLLGEEFEDGHADLSSHTAFSGIFSPRSFRSISSRSSARSAQLSSPASAAALSAAQLHPPLQIHALRPKPRSPSGSTTVVTSTPASRNRHSLYYMADEMVIFEVRGTH